MNSSLPLAFIVPNCSKTLHRIAKHLSSQSSVIRKFKYELWPGFSEGTFWQDKSELLIICIHDVDFHLRPHDPSHNLNVLGRLSGLFSSSAKHLQFLWRNCTLYGLDEKQLGRAQLPHSDLSISCRSLRSIDDYRLTEQILRILLDRNSPSLMSDVCGIFWLTRIVTPVLIASRLSPLLGTVHSMTSAFFQREMLDLQLDTPLKQSDQRVDDQQRPSSIHQFPGEEIQEMNKDEKTLATTAIRRVRLQILMGLLDHIKFNTFFCPNRHIEYVQGNSNLTITVPHGGLVKDNRIPERYKGTMVKDNNTIDQGIFLFIESSIQLSLSRMLRSAGGQGVKAVDLFSRGKPIIEAEDVQIPHIIVNHLRRHKIDMNRPLSSDADSVSASAWHHFHYFADHAKLQTIKLSSSSPLGERIPLPPIGLLLDMHGSTHVHTQLGFGLSVQEMKLIAAASLQFPNQQQTQELLEIASSSTIGRLCSSIIHSESAKVDGQAQKKIAALFFGDLSFSVIMERGHYFKFHQDRSAPFINSSPSPDSPLSSEIEPVVDFGGMPYFNGGFNVRWHGTGKNSRPTDLDQNFPSLTIDSIQVEVIPRLRSEKILYYFSCSMAETAVEFMRVHSLL